MAHVAKKRRVAKSDAILDSVGKHIKEQQYRQNIEQIHSYLEKSPELSGHVLWLLQSGKLSKENVPGMLPPTSNKFSKIAMNLKVEIVQELAGPTLRLEELKRKDPNIANRLLAFALNIDLNCAVFSKNIITLKQRCQDVHRRNGSRLSHLRVKDADIQWQHCGTFTLTPAGKGPYKHLKHISGVEYALEDLGHTVDDTWEIEKNYDTDKAALRKGRIHLLCIKLFTKEEAQNMRALKLDRVPTGPVPMSAAAAAAAAEEGIVPTPVLPPPAGAAQNRLPVPGAKAAAAPAAVPRRGGGANAPDDDDRDLYDPNEQTDGEGGALG